MAKKRKSKPPSKRKPSKPRPQREDANQAAFRTLQEVTKDH